MTTDARPRGPRKTDDLIGIAFTTAISVLAIVYIAAPFLPVLIAWQAVGVVYLVLLFTVFRNRTTHGSAESGGHALPGKLLEYLSWVLPIVASATGVASAVTLLTTEGANGTGGPGALSVGLLGSIGVVVAWLLLQTGFAEIYESVYERLAEPSTISFPGIDADPTLSDFLYMSFTVGTSFAISGATIASRKVRRVILVHSVTSFFYNAFLIAVAIQIIQGLIANS